MAPALSNATQTAIIASAFLVPVLTYLYYTKSQAQKSSAGPLPEATEIEALYIHPIKSCHGISVQSAKLLPTGLDLGTALTNPTSIFLSLTSLQTANGCG